MQALTFHATQFDIVDLNGQPWLRGYQIGTALGYADASSINRIYARNSAEFTEQMTASVKLTDPNGDLQETRIFSLRGAHLLAMFARTKVAKEFRAWALDVLEGVAEATTKSKHQPKALHSGLSFEQQDAIKALVKARVDELPEGKRAKAAITCWSSLKSKFGCTYKKIAPEKFTEAVSLVARVVLEGELLEAEQHQPDDALVIDYPASLWLANNPQLARAQTQPGSLLLSAQMLYGPDYRSPLFHLLTQLEQAGYNVEACQLEAQALRHHIETLDGRLGEILRQTMMGRQRGIRIPIAPPALPRKR